MTTTTLPIVSLNLPQENGALITFARAVHNALKDNESFPSPTPTLTVFAGDIDAFAAAETAAASKARGAVQTRDAKKRQVRKDLRHLRDYVQRIVDTQGDTRNADALIASAFMSVKKAGRHSRAELSAKNAGILGTVVLEAKAVAHQAVYYWQYSLDQQTWTSVPDTLQARTEIRGLTSAKTYYFRFRALTRAGEIGFSQVVSLLVH